MSIRLVLHLRKLHILDPENIIKLAIKEGCNAVATTFGNLSMMFRKYALKTLFISKLIITNLSCGAREHILQANE